MPLNKGVRNHKIEESPNIHSTMKWKSAAVFIEIRRRHRLVSIVLIDILVDS